MTPVVSVLIDTYNYGQFIEQAVESVLAQDFPAEQMEVLVVDDGSTDDTAERIAKYGQRLRYFRKPNGGQGSAFNFGVAQTRGEIVALLDADDYWLPGKLRRVVAEFEKHPEAGLVYHRLLERANETEELHEARFDFVAVSGPILEDVGQLLSYWPQPTSAVAFRLSVLQRLCPIPESIRLQADGYIGLLAPLISAVWAIPEFLAVYRLHGQNLYSSNGPQITRERTEQRIAMQVIIGKEVERWMVRNGHNPAKPPVREFLEQWRLYIEGQRHALSPPGRLGLLAYELRKSRCWSSQFGPKLRAINYFNVFGSFITGNSHFDVESLRTRLAARAKH
jgi:glycosyltransferase involved in cell wall biosynthesis